jgi:DNA-binding GntR family transcriptional regulator
MWVLPGRAELSVREHEEILEAIIDRDAARAAERMRWHIRSSQESFSLNA